MEHNGSSLHNIILGLSSACASALFHSIHCVWQQSLHDRWSLYWRLCLTLKNQSVALHSADASKREQLRALYTKFNEVRAQQQRTLVFVHWNGVKLAFMEGLYASLLCTLTIAVQFALRDYIRANISTSNQFLFYEDIGALWQCLRYNSTTAVLCAVLAVSVALRVIVLEDSRYHLSPGHSRGIFVASLVLLWASNVAVYYASGEQNYGAAVSWYDLIALMGVLFIVGGLLIHEDRFVVMVNAMGCHSDSVGEQYKVFKVHEYWHNVYFDREKSRLLGHSPEYLVPGYHSETEYSVMSQELTGTTTTTATATQTRLLQINPPEMSMSEQQAEQLYSLMPEFKDDNELKGAMNLLLGKDSTEPFKNKPSKYYPAFYE